MKKRVHRNWHLVRASWMVLLRYRMLLIYPLLSSIAVAIVAGYLPLALVRARISEEEAVFAFTPKGVAGYLVLYFVTCTIVQFFNVMLVADAVARFNGPYRFRLSGWRVAARRLPTIVAYSVLSSSLGSTPVVVIRWLARKVGIRSLPDSDAWALATFLGVPVIAVEGLTARPTLDRSEELLRSTWGDRFVGGTGVLIARICVVVFAFAGGLALLFLVTLIDYDPLSVAMAFLWLATFVFLFITGSAVSTIYCAATYRHCIGRPVPGFEALYDILGAVPRNHLPQEAVPPGAIAD